MDNLRWLTLVMAAAWPLSEASSLPVKYRDFDKYYGLSMKHNPFDKQSAESRQGRGGLDMPYYDLINTDDKPNWSMVLAAIRGGGKTELRLRLKQKYEKQTEPKALLLDILGNDVGIDRYLKTFITNVGKYVEEPFDFWKAEDFEQMLIMELVKNFAQLLNRLKPKQATLDETWGKKERLLVAATMALHIDQDSQIEVVKAVNSLIYEKSFVFDKGPFSNELSAIHDEQTSKRMSKLRETLRVADQNKALYLLVQMMKRDVLTEGDLEALHNKGPIGYLQLLQKCLYKLDHKVVVFVDSMDESPTVMIDQTPEKQRLRLGKIVRSSSEHMLSLIQDDFGMVMHIFAPSIPGLDWKNATEPVSMRKDKVFVTEVTWNYAALSEYVDLMLDHMREHSAYWWSFGGWLGPGRGSFKQLPTFKDLVGGQDQKERVLCATKHPRAFIAFIQQLKVRLTQMHSMREPPFIATPADVEHALTQARNSMLDEEYVLSGCDKYGRKEPEQVGAKSSEF